MARTRSKADTIRDKKSSGDYIPPALLLEDALNAGHPVVIGTLPDIADSIKVKIKLLKKEDIIHWMKSDDINQVDLGFCIMFIHNDKQLPINQNAMIVSNLIAGYRPVIHGKSVIIPKKLYHE